MVFTDDCYTDERVPSVSPSVLFSPTDCIAITDGINPSVKLDNVVVYPPLTCVARVIATDFVYQLVQPCSNIILRS